jgi:hypothetical protein
MNVTDSLPGKIDLVLVLGVLLALLGSGVVGWLYRRALVRLMMSAPETGTRQRTTRPRPAAGARPALSREALVAPWPTTADNAAARRRLIAVVIGLSLLMAISITAIEYPLNYQTVLTPRRLATGTVWAVWMMFPALAVLLRWSRWRLACVLLAWYALVVALVMSQSNVQQQLIAVMGGVALEIGVPMVLIMTFALGGVTRTVGAWLLPFFMVLVGLSVLGLDGLAMLAGRPQWLRVLFDWVTVKTLFVLAGVFPWLLAVPLFIAMARALERLYIRQWLSELGWLLTSIWFIQITLKAAGALASTGPKVVLLYLPLLWLPLAFLGARRWLAPRHAAPTLLVLRVFRRDAEVQALFDAVVDRWRLTGNTLMIAGTDLSNRTLDPGELFAFLGGRIGEQFVADQAQVDARIAALELRPDMEGRFRVNESFCRDSAWQPMLAALLTRADVVLTDLRGFQAHNEGCRYEIGELANAAAVRRVVTLFDRTSDRALAQRDAGAAPAGRYVWIDASVLNARIRDQVLAALLITDADVPGNIGSGKATACACRN